MSTQFSLHFLRRFVVPAAAAVLLLSPGGRLTAAIDENASEQIWKLKFGVSEAQMGNEAWMNQDSDGDGLKNGAEVGAGTNPFDPVRTIKISNLSLNGSQVNLSFPTEIGKLYRVESTGALEGPWTLQPQPSPVQVIGDGTTKTLTLPYEANHFYRVEVTEIDSDGDGLSDWAERSVGLNAAAAQSVPGVNDYEYVTAQVAQPNVVSIKAAAPFASEDGPTAGMLKVTRTQNLFPLTITYNVGGTAVAGEDYQPLSGTVTLPAHAGSADIPVNPVEQPAVEGAKSVTASLNPPGAGQQPYTLGSPSTATVIINDSTEPVGTGLMARYYDHASTTYAHAANFGSAGTYTYTRTVVGPPASGTILVPYTYNGTPALQVGHLVKMTFTSGNLNAAAYNHANYTVTEVTPGVSFRAAISSATTLPANSSGNLNFSIQSFPHPAVIERIDPVVSNDWVYGTPNDVGITPGNPVDNYSTLFEGYLNPTTAGSYQFQLDADDMARVLVDLNNNGTFDLPGEQVVEHGWDGTATPETVGTFKVSASIPLVVPASPAQRYKIRVEHVETTGDARCRLQWRLGTGTFVTIPQANVFSHTMASTYSVTSGVATINTPVLHGLASDQVVTLNFSSGSLFTPPANFSGDYQVTVLDSDTFTVSVPAAPNATGNVLLASAASTTTGWLNRVYANVTFQAPAGRVGVDNNGPVNANSGIWGSGTPSPTLIGKDTFSVRWTGQIQPQFTEEYTISVHADDGCRLWINGQNQELRAATGSSVSGSTYSYNAATGDTTITYTASAAKPNSFVAGETVRLDPTSSTLTHANGSTYTYDAGTGDAVIDYTNLTNVTAGGFAVGQAVELDPTAGTLSSLGSIRYVITAAVGSTFTVNFGTGTFASQSTAATINISDVLDRVITAATANTFTVNFGAMKYPDGAAGNMNVEIVNKPLNEWSSMGNERFVRIPMVGGVRYDIQLDTYDNTGYARSILYWHSPSQTKQVIPTNRLYPSNGVLAPAAHISPTEATALVGGFFSHPIVGSNGATVTLSGNPAWLTYSGGVLSGTPPVGAAGDYQILITITNAAGSSTSVLNLHVDQAGGTIAREYWNNVAGTSVASIPTTATPSGTTNLTSLEAPTDAGENFGARIRGYITAPITGNYYFWIAGNNAAELWISNDDEPINALKRAWVNGGSPTPRSWGVESTQKSPWLALEQGQKYYIEILHKASSGVDNLAVGWAKPGDAGTGPSQVVPGYVLSPYVPPAPGSTPGTLYVATMLSQNGADTDGVGSSTFRLSEDESYAIVNFNYGGLSGALTDWHVHNDPYLTHASSIMYDPTEPPANSGPQPDGSHKWTIPPMVGTLSKAEVVELLKQGKAYINLHTALYPNGEIRGNYTVANGTRTFTPPPDPPSFADDHNTNSGAARFLTQATFGANPADIAALKASASYDAWINAQFTQPVTLTLPEVIRTENSSAQGGAFDETLVFNSWWRNSVSGPDQLRQRVAFALSEILVVSAQGPLDNRAEALAFFYDTLVNHAFGNFRDLLEATTLAYPMGRYLDMFRNDKPDLAIGRSPNENYAREIKQLFSIGLFRMWPDGTLMLNSKDELIPTYTQREIVGFAHVFTGWDYGYDGGFRTAFGAPANFTRNMREVPARHFTGPKRILNNEVLPGLTSVGNQALDPYAVHNSTHQNDPAYQNLPAQELDASHDQLFNHPNVGPFICRQLIQRMVTSHPSRDYLYRVVQKFNNDGTGVRGNMKAVIKAILLDYEARSPDMYQDNVATGNKAKPSFGKQREPVLRVAAAARAFRPPGFSGTYSQTAANGRTITVNATGHRLVNGNNVFLEFTSGSPAPWIGTYTVGGATTNSFTVTAQGWATGTYNIPANSSTCTVTMSNHWLQVGHQVFVDFTSGGANGVAGLDGTVRTLLSATAQTGTNGNFTFTVPTSTSARSGNVMIPRFSPGSYTTSASGLPAPQDRRVTMDTNWDHHLNVGDQVQLNFYGGNPLPVDMVVTVDTVVDLNTWTFLATATGTNLGTNQGNNSVYQFPLVSQPLVRSGNVTSRPSTFAMGNTDADIDQSPINAPTVFNFYLPDYKFPGTLASQGITTPEFQETAETSVVRQANFIERGIYALGNTNGLSSFRSGSNALVMDLGPWMGNATSAVGTVGAVLGAGPQTGQAWTSNANLPTLIDRFDTLFLGGNPPTAPGLPAAVKTEIQNFVLNTTNIPYNNSTPSDAEKVARLRAVLHFILTSPDFTIQR